MVILPRPYKDATCTTSNGKLFTIQSMWMQVNRDDLEELKKLDELTFTFRNGQSDCLYTERFNIQTVNEELIRYENDKAQVPVFIFDQAMARGLRVDYLIGDTQSDYIETRLNIEPSNHNKWHPGPPLTCDIIIEYLTVK